MSSLSNYPVAPSTVDPRILLPSAGFKSEVIKVLTALFFFVTVYLALIASGVALAALCVAGGIGLIVVKPMVITIGLGIGLAGLGVMVLLFLVKFVFKRHKVDRSGLIEIKESEQPRLYQFIRNLTKETATNFPKSIYISHDVNASVFYDSGFWSMFLPVRKNLHIGLGLVNSVNISEFKAILAHEFGHFSQRSMKLGSFVYNMNRIIFNMLYDNDGFERTLEQFGNASGYFAIFAIITAKIVRGIQWVLQQVYTVVNKQYMGLSRQMEFHADTVAASVSGANHLISSLRRLEVADTTYSNVFSFYEQHFKEALRPVNVYPQHRVVMREFASFHGLTLQNGLPLVNSDSFAYFNRSRITIKDQWASHPSTDDREKHLLSLNLETPVDSGSAWNIFDDAEKLQQRVTEKLFAEVKFEKQVLNVDEKDFSERFVRQRTDYELNSVYKGFFDSRHISKVELNNVEHNVFEFGTLPDALLTDEVLSLPYRINGVRIDLQTLDAIKNRALQVKHFEFAGNRYKASDAAMLYAELEIELKEYESELVHADEMMIASFIRQAKVHQNDGKLLEKYKQYYSIVDSCEENIKVYVAIQECLAPLYQSMQVDQIQQAIAKLKLEEVKFRECLELNINDPANTSLIKLEQHQRATEYLAHDWQYFNAPVYNQPALDLLNEVLFLLYHISSEKAFRARREILDVQLPLAGVLEAPAEELATVS